MSRTTTFFEFKPATKAKWERLAKLTAEVAYHESRGDDRCWSRDEIMEHIELVMNHDGEELDERRKGMYFERMRMASVYGGTVTPTLDLVHNGDEGFAYKWLRNKELPSGFLDHILSIAGGMPRLSFDYFVMLAKEYSLDDLVTAIGATKSMTLLLLAELYARVHRADHFTPDQFEYYIGRINELKSEVQTRITKEEALNFNSMMGALLLGSGDN